MSEPSRAVFLSYASEDAEAARRICDALRAGGIEVWFDQCELRGGDAWDAAIRKQIRACALFIPVISRNTDAREEGYFRLEWKLAVDRSHLMTTSKMFLLPVVVDNSGDHYEHVPDKFRELQWTHLPAGDTSPLFVARVAQLLSHNTPVAPRQFASGPLAIPAHSVPPGAMREQSIAVLPFTNLSADKDNEYFSDGLAEEILNALCQVEGLRVASRSSAFFFKGRSAAVSEIATRLQVANVLEGSVRRFANRVRVTVQLVDVKNSAPLWSERYDREMQDIFEIQDDIARMITARLKVTLGAGAQRSTNNLEAYELYLKGLYHWHQRSPGTLRSAIQCFEQAIKLDPNYALAHAGLADCYGIFRIYGWMSAEASRPPALAAVTQAMAVAPSLWEVNFSRAFYIFCFERAWREADVHFEKAIAINPRSSLAQGHYAVVLAAEGRAEDAAARAILACQLDPFSSFVHGLASMTYCGLGRFDAAERAAHHALELQPDYLLGLWNRGIALCGLGRNNEAIESLERVTTLSRAPDFVGFLGFGYARAGRLEEARQLLSELRDRGASGEYIPAFATLNIHLGLGDVSATRATFAKAIAEPVSPASLCVPCGHFLQAFRTDPEIDRMHREFLGW